MLRKINLHPVKLLIWTGKQFVVDRRSERRRPGSFNDRYIGMVYRMSRKEATA